MLRVSIPLWNRRLPARVRRVRGRRGVLVRIVGVPSSRTAQHRRDRVLSISGSVVFTLPARIIRAGLVPSRLLSCKRRIHGTLSWIEQIYQSIWTSSIDSSVAHRCRRRREQQEKLVGVTMKGLSSKVLRRLALLPIEGRGVLNGNCRILPFRIVHHRVWRFDELLPFSHWSSSRRYLLHHFSVSRLLFTCSPIQLLMA